MAHVTREELEECVRAIGDLWDNEVAGSGHERTAGQASTNLMSGSGLLYVPTEVIQMLTQAIEVGYATALKAVRDGNHDEDIRHWRPDLSGD